MGFKLLKEAYDIKHIVCVCNEKKYKGEVICIGSAYVHDLIVIGMDGKVLKRYNDGRRVNEELYRYQQEFDADADKLKRIVTTSDVFDADKNQTVYIYDFGRIREELCQEFGWPNVTNKGELMYENTAFKTFREAYKCALENTAYDKWDRVNNRECIKERLHGLWRAFRWIFIKRFNWFYVRTILRIKATFKKN